MSKHHPLQTRPPISLHAATLANLPQWILQLPPKNNHSSGVRSHACHCSTIHFGLGKHSAAVVSGAEPIRLASPLFSASRNYTMGTTSRTASTRQNRQKDKLEALWTSVLTFMHKPAMQRSCPAEQQLGPPLDRRAIPIICRQAILSMNGTALNTCQTTKYEELKTRCRRHFCKFHQASSLNALQHEIAHAKSKAQANTSTAILLSSSIDRMATQVHRSYLDTQKATPPHLGSSACVSTCLGTCVGGSSMYFPKSLPNNVTYEHNIPGLL
eukprot:355955-Chlamydomonas_euryale.AAC.1